MQDIPAERKKRGPSSLVLQEVIRQAPAEYVTVGWLTSTLHRHSFGIIMLSLGLLATTPVGSTVPGLMLVVMAVLAGVLVIVWLKYFRSHPPFPQRDPRMLEALGLHHPQASQFAVAKYEGLP